MTSSACRFQWPRGLSRGSAPAALLGLRFRISPVAWMSVCCECCVLSGRGLCDELIGWLIDYHWVWAHKFPIHLGLIDGPFVLHNLISTQEEPDPLLEVPDGPRLQNLMASCVQEMIPDIPFIFSLKSPSKRTTSRFPNRAPMERDTRLQGILHISHRTHQNSSNKRAPRRKCPTMFPKSEAPTEADAHFRALLNIY